MRFAAIVLALCACGEKKSEPRSDPNVKPTVIVTRNEITYNGQPVYFDSTIVDWLLDAAGGAETPSKRPIAPDASRSPDGKRRADFADGKVVVTVDGKPKSLVLHPVDAKDAKPGCCYWIDNRVVWMSEGYLDTDTMKVSPRVEDERDVRVAYIRGTRTAIMISDDGTWLANLVVP